MHNLLYILPLIILVYYIWSNWPYLKKQPFIKGLLIAGSILLFVGIFAFGFIPKYASLARFSGILLIFIGIAVHLYNRNKTNESL